ncbi:MAG: hypothetical protein Q4G22_03700 [Paracoccus sp. (in: a-proteobacteria)]|uniref:hypothetical protein n=1 Tax=Paracoccus sp. TaxID=267 RepID=UPI0026DF9FEF|nr:hypothetical protein [Paracoccus sp. (in: a-proteobacteria)]MDO5630923.1 hypothetical protein [Paracoccus sp. (in: a-proteobacteria)]
MKGHDHLPAAIPSPLSFLGTFLLGLFFGGMFGFLLTVAMFFIQLSSPLEGIMLFAGLIAIAGVYHLLGWAVFVLPFKTIKWLWQWVNGHPVSTKVTKQPAPVTATHWTERAAYWSGFALMLLLILRGNL